MIADPGPGPLGASTTIKTGAATTGDSPMPGLEITATSSLIALSGELDIDSAPLLAGVLERLTTPGGTIEIDVAALTFIDSSGLRVLCTAASRLGPQGHLIVSQPTRAVRRTIELTGLERIVEIVDIRQRGSRKRGVGAHGTDDEEPPR